MTLDPDLSKRIIQAVEHGFAEQVAFTQKLVQNPSLRGHEHTVQDLFFRTLKTRGFDMDRFKMDRAAIEAHPGGSKYSEGHSDAPIVVGIHRPRIETGRSLILQSHLDVVPEGPHDMWDDPPFSGKIEGDWMFGRGAGDMKAGAAANIFALDALRRIGLQPAATVYVQSVVEEESTGNGALQTYLQGYTADAVLIPEPMDEMLVRANIGVLWFQVQVRGVPVHVREMGVGANAIDAANRVIGALREMEADWNAETGDHPHFENDPHPINLNIGKIEGGDWASSVPSWCTIDCRLSVYPGRGTEDAAREVTDRIAAFAQSDGFFIELSTAGRLQRLFRRGLRARNRLRSGRSIGTGAPGSPWRATAIADDRLLSRYPRICAL